MSTLSTRAFLCPKTKFMQCFPHTTSHQWAADDDSKNRKLPLGKGQRFVILHAGCEDGFLNGCELVFKGISTDGKSNLFFG
jgi:hypothetical protein